MRQACSHSDRLAEDHMGFARVMVHRLAGSLPSHVDQESLESDALFGLVLAARSFDPTRGVAFTTYAAKRIHGAMLDGLRERQAGLRNQRAPVVMSLNLPVRDSYGREVALSDLLSNDDEPIGAALERQEEVAHLMRQVDSASRQLLREYYFAALPQDQIGRRLGVSASRVSQLIKGVRRQMRQIACAN